MTAVETVIAAVHARWPAVHVDPTALASVLGANPVASTSPLAVDLALACALAAGDRGALEVFERELLPDVRGAIARLDRSGDLMDDVMQQVREKLLVADGRPRIGEYRGRGPLVAWIQAVAINEALALRRARRRDHALDDNALLIAVESDPLLAITKHAYRQEFTEAFSAGLAALNPHDRTLLRMCFVDAIGTERLAALYAVHRATMFRWLRDARSCLIQHLRTEMVARTGIDHDEVDSLIRAVGSSLDINW